MKRALQLAALIVTVAGLAWAYDNYIGYFRACLGRLLYPPIRQSPGTLGLDIEREAAQRRLNSVLLEARRVRALAESAKTQGHNVLELEEKLAQAEDLARQGLYNDAKMYLNIVRIKLPRASERLRPAVQEDADANPFPDLENKRRR